MAAITIPGMFLTGNHAGRPSSGVGKGTLYACSTHTKLYQTTDTGSTWVDWFTAAGSSGAVATDTIWDAAGDLAVGTGADTAAKLSIGASGLLLKSNGTTASWAFPTFIGASAYHNATQALSNNTLTALAMNSELYDTTTIHDTATNNSRMTIPSGKGGYWRFEGTVYFDPGATGERIILAKLNGTTYYELARATGNSTDPTVLTGGVILSVSAADYVELFARQVTGGSLNLSSSNGAPRLTATMLGV